MTAILDIPGSNPPNPFSTLINTHLTNPAASADETATHLVTTVTTSPDPAHALWELWDAFFTAVVTSSASHASLLALLAALQTQPATHPENVLVGTLRSYTQTDGKLHWATLPRFSAQWRDVHDILESWRDWDGVRASGVKMASSGDEYYLRFCDFSAALVKVTNGKGEVHPIQVFYVCCNVLEREVPRAYFSQPKPHRMPLERVWALDVRVAATWVRDGGQALWEMDPEELRRHWAAALDEETELWPRRDGLTRERLWALSTEETLDRETRTVVMEAAEVVRAILDGNPA